jgi:predicted RNA-binding protein YlxR (DUF448 family)
VKNQRKCVGCRTSFDKATLLRVEKGESKRGAYVCKSIACIEQARKNKGFERSFKMNVEPDLYSNLLSLIKF